MAICKHRPEPEGLLTPCSFGGRGRCLCAEETAEWLAQEPQPEPIAQTAQAEATAAGWRRVFTRRNVA